MNPLKKDYLEEELPKELSFEEDQVLENNKISIHYVGIR